MPSSVAPASTGSAVRAAPVARPAPVPPPAVSPPSNVAAALATVTPPIVEGTVLTDTAPRAGVDLAEIDRYLEGLGKL